MKPLTYYIETPAVRSIGADYGYTLQDITFIEQLTLVSIISQFLAAISDDPDDYDLLTAADDSPLEQTAEVRDILERLQMEVSESLLRGFLLAIVSNLSFAPPIIFDSDLYNRVNTALFEDGVDREVAKRAAFVVASHHIALPRTPKEAAAVNAAWQQFRGYSLPKNVLSPLLFPDEE